MDVYAGSQLSHWDFPRKTASAALMTEFGNDNELAVADLLEGSGLTHADLAFAVLADYQEVLPEAAAKEVDA